MELCLAGKAECRARLERRDGRALEKLYVRQSGAVSGSELTLEDILILVVAEEEVAVDSLEIAIDVFECGNRFDLVDRGNVTFGGDASAFLSVKLLDFRIPVVECGSDMGGRPSGLATADLAIVDYHDCTTGTGEQVCDRHAGNTGTYNAHAGPNIVIQFWHVRHVGSHPDRRRVTGIASHCGSLMAHGPCHVIL